MVRPSVLAVRALMTRSNLEERVAGGGERSFEVRVLGGRDDMNRLPDGARGLAQLADLALGIRAGRVEENRDERGEVRESFVVAFRPAIPDRPPHQRSVPHGAV